MLAQKITRVDGGESLKRHQKQILPPKQLKIRIEIMAYLLNIAVVGNETVFFWERNGVFLGTKRPNVKAV